MQILGKHTADEIANSSSTISRRLHPSPGGPFVVPPPLGASIQAIVSPVKNEGIPEGAILSVPMLAIAKIICDRVRPFAALGHFLEG
jgi:hypothetical protein